MRHTASAAPVDHQFVVDDDPVRLTAVSVFGVRPAEQRSDNPMSDTDNNPTASAPTDGHQTDDDSICAIPLNGNTVLFDANYAERWIQSDTVVDLANRV
jgi:hypothetical protein